MNIHLLRDVELFPNAYKSLPWLLLSLGQVCYGAPARATDVGVVQLRYFRFTKRGLFTADKTFASTSLIGRITNFRKNLKDQFPAFHTRKI